ncbi:SDR family NAD(P)-dependent oxidoreductase [Luteimicrobium subarcticum]|uniref:NAD(P)-dependent dehydrogenase (Short-subunit alcohol dehydrogenase family) n=1 Tax=Luteimicrobium subarcticum TaxID=620910 RepID=A0A2M8W6V4_9MICO|nr:SDR family oxidoreductase [Luteimicrobium subarcticum]PJI86622.1 NAD(P)-dependent dehydrogenase (short-subunit alcohol dehydrogenase family) [Luteimicrobium subarcticum]
MLLDDKVAVVYGGGGTIGGAVARAFAREGARVFVTGHRLGPAEKVVAAIEEAGGRAEAAEVDALDEDAVDAHLDHVVAAAGRVDVSFNAVGLSDRSVLGSPLTDLDVDRFLLPVVTYARTWFVTARLAARRMVPQGSGVIMTVSALPARAGSPLNGGYGPAQAAKEAMVRDLSLELAPRGVRVVGVRPHAIPDSPTMAAVFAAKPASGLTWDEFVARLAGSTHPRRSSTVEEVAEVAAFLASDRASGMTGTIVNLTMGSLDD